MTYVHIDKVPNDAEIFAGPKGGKFYFRNGNRVYISFKANLRRKERWAPKRGAFLRFIEHQAGL